MCCVYISKTCIHTYINGLCILHSWYMMLAVAESKGTCYTEQALPRVGVQGAQSKHTSAVIEMDRAGLLQRVGTTMLHRASVLYSAGHQYG